MSRSGFEAAATGGGVDSDDHLLGRVAWVFGRCGVRALFAGSRDISVPAE